jgi:ubiquinol-cytochrome c reductase cytochrome b subunit
MAQRTSRWTGFITWLDERTGFAGLFKKEVTDKLVPQHHSNWEYFSCFGGITLIFFVIQVVTGLILLAGYVPHPDHAFESVHHISNTLSYGWVIRRVHAIGANFMIIVVVIHLLKVFATGAYKPPRELHWVSGVLLFLLVLALNLTGYLLPWSQLSYWASTVATAIPGVVPGIGPYLVEFVRGGSNVTGETLNRFFAVHTMLLPVIVMAFMGLHFVMIRKTGIAEPL